MTGLQEVLVPSLPLRRFHPLIGDQRFHDLEVAAELTRASADGHIFWNVNSTASGGGVAEMLRVLVGYGRGVGLDVRWLITRGDAPFFAITKRVHNRVHGEPGDSGSLGDAERAHYEAVARANADLLCQQIRPGDVVLLHDPQTAGLCGLLRGSGARVVWRCHIGSDHANEWTEQAWAFLRPYILEAEGFVFSRRAHIPPDVPEDRVRIIPPSIDPFSPKNRELDAAMVENIVRHIGLYGGDSGKTVLFDRTDGTPGRIEGEAAIVGSGSLDAALPLVVQVSRWDRLKDMRGVLIGFTRALEQGLAANLALVGPSVAGVSDDPEGAAVLAECTDLFHSLPDEQRARVRLVSLPMDDVDENAIMVNALQRCASIVVQKSLAEGFGLTVAEAMWKAKPVVASAVGGIVDQVAPGTGVLLDDPADLDAFASAVAALLADPEAVERYGRSARAYVVDNFVGDRHLLHYGAMLAELFT